jgi:hypothetical protein
VRAVVRRFETAKNVRFEKAKNVRFEKAKNVDVAARQL